MQTHRDGSSMSAKTRNTMSSALSRFVSFCWHHAESPFLSLLSKWYAVSLTAVHTSTYSRLGSARVRMCSVCFFPRLGDLPGVSEPPKTDLICILGWLERMSIYLPESPALGRLSPEERELTLNSGRNPASKNQNKTKHANMKMINLILETHVGFLMYFFFYFLVKNFFLAISRKYNKILGKS